MIGVLIGVVSSLIIFTFYTKDEKAIKQNKQNKLKQQKIKQQEQRNKQQQIEKIKNDPNLQKKKQQRKNHIQSTFINKIDQNDKKIIEQYLQNNRKSGKTDQQIIKQASNQATIFMSILFIIIITITVFMAILYGVQLEQLKDHTLKFLSKFFPKITSAVTSTTNDL